jgi:hypothetical protein
MHKEVLNQLLAEFGIMPICFHDYNYSCHLEGH